MKRFIGLIILLLNICYIDTVLAYDESICNNANNECAICSYHYEGYALKQDFDFAVTYEDNGNVKFVSKPDNFSNYGNDYVFKLIPEDFVDYKNNKLVCPTIYYNTEEVNDNFKFTFSMTDKYTPLKVSDSYNNNKSSVTGTVKKCNAKILDNHNLSHHLVWEYDSDTKDVKFYETSGDWTFEYLRGSEDISYFAQDCNSQKLFLSCDNSEKTCAVTLTSTIISDGTRGSNPTSNETELDEKHDNEKQTREVLSVESLCKFSDNCNINIANFCKQGNISKTLRFLGWIFFLLKVLVPLVIIGMGIKDLFDVIVSGKEDVASKKIKSLVTRIAIGVIIFLLPGIVDFLFNTITDITKSDGLSGMNNCKTCILNPGDCYTEGE